MPAPYVAGGSPRRAVRRGKMMSGAWPPCSRTGPELPAGRKEARHTGRKECSGVSDLHVLQLVFQGNISCFLFVALMLLLLLL